MTVTSTTYKNQYTGDGTQTTFAYGFKVFVTSDLEVYVADVLKTLTTDYTVTGAGAESGGNVVFGTAPVSGANVTIIRSIPYTQVADYTAYDPFKSETHETALDKSVMQSQQLLEKHDRTVKMKPSFTGSEVLVDAPTANKALKWDSTGVKLVNSTDDVDGITSAASASATAAATSETNAATSATNAATSETNASTSATNAATSETNAASSATSAASSLDEFTDLYLGTKSSDPTVDNDGNALQDGALYWNTTNNALMVYDLGNTTWNRTAPSSSDQTNINTVSASIDDVNRYANEYKIAASAPGSPSEGDLWYDSTNNVLKFYDGAAWLTIQADTDVKVLVSVNDTTAGYLNGKLVGGTNVTLTEGSDGGNETLTIASTDTDTTYTAGATLSLATTTFSLNLANANEWTKTQNFNSTSLTFDATQDWDLSSNQVCDLTLTANTTFDAPTNLKDGGFYSITLIQDGTGSRTASWNTVFKWAGGTAPTLTTTASAKDIMVFRSDGTNMYEVGRQLNVS
nr:putative tail fiber protein [uncultured Gammaproteobacteria bacterium]